MATDRNVNPKDERQFVKTKFLLSILVGLFLAFLAYQTTKTTAGNAGNGSIPGGDITMERVAGGSFSLNEFAGKVLIVDFWATWCPPCKREIPGYIRLYRKYRDQGVEIVGITLQSGTAADVSKFVAAAGINYTIVLGNNAIVRAFGGVSAFPTTFVLDQSGKIVRKYVGFRPEEVFENDIRSLLQAN